MKGAFIITTLEDTQRLAENLASELRGGLPRRNKAQAGLPTEASAQEGVVIGLVGNLGAGKTTFVQFLARALGVKENVNSPTFNIIKIYKVKGQRLKVKCFVHIDAYRLNSPEELTALGVEEYFNDPHTVTVIEWADRARDILPKDTRVIQFEIENSIRSITMLHL